MSLHFEAFLRQRRSAAETHLPGDGRSVADLLAESGQVTCFDPSGGVTEGAPAVRKTVERDASDGQGCGTTTLEILDQGMAADLAFWCGLQHGEVEFGGIRRKVTLRITEVFRFLDGRWQMVHRHASPQG